MKITGYCSRRLPGRRTSTAAKLIVDVTAVLKNEKRDVSISNIIVRNDRLKAKVNEVNEPIGKMCYERNFSLLDHSKTLKHFD